MKPVDRVLLRCLLTMRWQPGEWMDREWTVAVRTFLTLCCACSYVFWIGDLNFRMDELSSTEVKNRIAAGDIESLWTYDQVIRVETCIITDV